MLVAHVDGSRERQVVDNLLSNAVKYTEPDGSVTVTLRQDGDNVALTVEDSGIGMTGEEVEHVFTRFYGGEVALRREIPGTGSGLNIVKTIVDAHDGELSLRSDAGAGSTFRATLPSQAVVCASCAERQRQASKSRKKSRASAFRNAVLSALPSKFLRGWG